MPDVSISDQALINDAVRKANTLGLNSFVIWNFTNCSKKAPIFYKL